MLSKERFENKDRLIKGISEEGHFKVSVVKTTDVVKTAKQKHELSLLNTVLLGRALTGIMLLASELKGEERIQLRIDCDGPVGQIVTEANRVGEIRGYVQNSGVELDYARDEIQLSDGIGKGVLTVKKTLYNEAEPKTSTIEIIKGNITDDLAYYMFQSEQVPSAVILDVGIDDKGEVTQAGGILVQRLPDAPEGKIDGLQENLKNFKSLHKLFSEGMYIDDVMTKALAPFKVRELDRQPVDFFCRCTRDRFVNALTMLDYDELKEISDEGQELVCHFCNEHYQVSQDEIEEIVLQVKAKMN
ncbi:Hsp33 family molecular chaperone HslO [Aliifodinibius sp. S!AR15-10]|uniref:Hsp33 family molecular chaperone HslO n=1 Tax=Aliifodinibius sp. S!AR15-10 TaxID=2950437 RepID=UPI002856E7E9|nr:Hsp33 family molecular chaperone HslO [Aliifodinibius sp. S!AR15-10]MDR8394377.1 Hsp33 family molecular chaperone HslO [Aliifodinibius sp. S!AR15-10]